jgi:hypothetical protein
MLLLRFLFQGVGCKNGLWLRFHRILVFLLVLLAFILSKHDVNKCIHVLQVIITFFHHNKASNPANELQTYFIEMLCKNAFVEMDSSVGKLVSLAVQIFFMIYAGYGKRQVGYFGE